jgi:hypothetical protein
MMNIENQIDQLSKQLSKRSRETFLGEMVANPRVECLRVDDLKESKVEDSNEVKEALL